MPLQKLTVLSRCLCAHSKFHDLSTCYAADKNPKIAMIGSCLKRENFCKSFFNLTFLWLLNLGKDYKGLSQSGCNLAFHSAINPGPQCQPPGNIHLSLDRHSLVLFMPP